MRGRARIVRPTIAKGLVDLLAAMRSSVLGASRISTPLAA
jgi:hypothetical protein